MLRLAFYSFATYMKLHIRALCKQINKMLASLTYLRNSLSTSTVLSLTPPTAAIVTDVKCRHLI